MPFFCLSENLFKDNQERANINGGKRTQKYASVKSTGEFLIYFSLFFEILKASSMIIIVLGLFVSSKELPVILRQQQSCFFYQPTFNKTAFKRSSRNTDFNFN